MTRQLSDVAASVRARLMNRRTETGEDFGFLLQRFVAERFLYRLGESKHRDRFVLKGAMLLNLWGASAFRPTRDIDFTGYGERDAEAIVTAFREVCEVAAADDGVRFDAASLSASQIMDATEYQGIRVKLRAYLGTAVIPMQIDVGFGDLIEPPAQEIDYPPLLDFPPPRVRGYHRDGVVAEKLHAITVLGEQTSRYKDFHDLYLLATTFGFSHESLSAAVSATFGNRNTPIPELTPAALTPAFFADASHQRMWEAFLDKNSITAAPRDFTVVGELLRTFTGAVWDRFMYGPMAKVWPPGGPWSAAAEEQAE